MEEVYEQAVLALILSLILVFGLLPAAGPAAAASSATVYVTVSVAGEIPTGKSGKLMAQVPVTVTDRNKNEVPDIDDALFALHETYYDGGAEAGYASEEGAYGLSLTKLWGDLGPAFGYWLNNTSAWSLTDPVASGDHLSVYVYQDQDTWSDSYTKFDAFRKTVPVGESLTLVLESAGYDASYNMVWSPLEGASLCALENDTGVLATTDAAGRAKLTFSEVGTYYISASHEDRTIVPPVCVVTVTASENYASVRIEGNGYGTDGTETGIGTVLPYTLVDLDALDPGFETIDVVNAALKAGGKAPAERRTALQHFRRRVRGQAGTDWYLMLNDESAPSGLDGLNIRSGDNLVLMLTGYDSNWFITTDYACFKIVSSRSDLQYGYPYGEVTLKLYAKSQHGWDNADWIVTPVANTAVDCNGAPAWTPEVRRKRMPKTAWPPLRSGAVRMPEPILRHHGQRERRHRRLLPGQNGLRRRAPANAFFQRPQRQ